MRSCRRQPDAQPAARVYRIGTLGNENTPVWEGLRQGLRDLGYVEGRNITTEARWSDGSPDRLPALARELVALKPDVIVASSTQAIRAAKDATTTIPIVMVLASFPDKMGLVESLARPGGNVTGLSTLGPNLIAKRVELLKEIVPKATRLAVLVDPANPVESLALRELVASGRGGRSESPDLRSAHSRRGTDKFGSARVERGRCSIHIW